MSVLVCLLPPLSSIELPVDDVHCTVVWGGEWGTHDAAQYERMASRCAFAARHFPPFEALFTGVDMFGKGEEKTPVLRCEHAFLYGINTWFAEYSESEYKAYRPHVSVPMGVPSVLPTRITFDRIALWLGDSRITDDVERRTWRLGSGVPSAG